MKQLNFKITANGFIKVEQPDGIIEKYFYVKGAEKDFLKAGYKQVF